MAPSPTTTVDSTFEAAEDAEGWLTDRRREIGRDDWTPPTTRPPITFSEHAERWLTNRTLKPRSRYHYRKMLDAKLLPTFENIALKHITADLIDDWYYRSAMRPLRRERTPTASYAPSSATPYSVA